MDKLFDKFPEQLKNLVINNKIETNQVVKPRLSRDQYAFPRLKKLPLATERNVYSAFMHFWNVKGHTEAEFTEAYQKILKVADSYKICTIEFIRQYESKLRK